MFSTSELALRTGLRPFVTAQDGGPPNHSVPGQAWPAKAARRPSTICHGAPRMKDGMRRGRANLETSKGKEDSMGRRCRWRPSESRHDWHSLVRGTDEQGKADSNGQRPARGPRVHGLSRLIISGDLKMPPL